MTTWPRVRIVALAFYDRGDSVESSHESNRRWIVWWNVRRLAITWLPAVDEPDSWTCRKTGFPAVPATLSRHAINCVPVHRFLMKNAGNRTYRLNGVNFRALCTCAHTHACRKTEPARFWRVFGWFVACFAGFPSETPLRASQAVLSTDVMVK